MAAVRFPPKSYAPAAADFMVQRYGIQAVNTREPSGSAIINFRTTKNAPRPIYMMMTSKKFLTACEKIMEHKDVFIASCQQVIELRSDCSAIDSEMSEIQEQPFQNETNIRALITENMRNPIKLDEYTEKYNILDTERMLHLQKQKEMRLSRREFLKDMISEVAGGKLDISFFNERAWKILIQSVTVLEDGKWFSGFRMMWRLQYKMRPTGLPDWSCLVAWWG